MLRNNQKKFVYVLVLILPFLLFFSQQKIFRSIKHKTVDVVSGPLKAVSYPLKEFRKLLYYHRTFDEYVRLRKRADVLEARLVGQEEVFAENARLLNLLEFKRKLIYSSVAAGVIGRNPSFWNSSMIIDKGEGDGLKQGMSVVSASGVVGKISEVGQKTSKVILVTDSQFSVAGQIQRLRESVLVTGSLKGVCRLKFLKEKADVRVGDKIITSKLSESFPEGLMIGRVVEVNENSRSGGLDCWVKPVARLSQLEEVLVILK